MPLSIPPIYLHTPYEKTGEVLFGKAPLPSNAAPPRKLRTYSSIRKCRTSTANTGEDYSRASTAYLYDCYSGSSFLLTVVHLITVLLIEDINASPITCFFQRTNQSEARQLCNNDTHDTNAFLCVLDYFWNSVSVVTQPCLASIALHAVLSITSVSYKFVT